jgi:hypothetical protein
MADRVQRKATSSLRREVAEDKCHGGVAEFVDREGDRERDKDSKDLNDVWH